MVLSIVIGIGAGIVTGLIPGIHINLISTIILLLSPQLLAYFTYEELIILIISMGIVHSFLDFIPSILFGVPSSDTALSVLPAHQLVLNGEGRDALYLSASGSLLGAYFSIPLLFLLFYILPTLIAIVTPYISIVLLLVVVWFIIEEKSIRNKMVASMFVITASLYGFLLLNSFHLRQPLLVIFTSIFGIASILFSILGESSGIPPQKKTQKILPKGTIKSILIGNCCAALCSALPGLGNAQATTLMSIFYKTTNSRIFLIISSSLNTTSFFVSIITLYLLDKARNGAIVVVSNLIENISIELLLQIMVIGYVVAIIGYGLTILIGEIALKSIEHINEKKMNISLLLLLCLVITIAEGIYGIICLLGITSLGFLGLILQIRRVHFMSILLIPVALFLL